MYQLLKIQVIEVVLLLTQQDLGEQSQTFETETKVTVLSLQEQQCHC